MTVLFAFAVGSAPYFLLLGNTPQKLLVELPSLVAGKTPPTEFRVFPLGEFTTTKGTFSFTEESARLVLDAASQWGNKHSIDYEHRALYATEMGGEAPAAAWYDLELRADGLWAVNVEWTAKGAAYLSSREYRYFSPAFFDDEGVVTRLVNIALTNIPATERQQPLAASATSPHSEPSMKTVISALALSADATEAQTLSAVTELKANQAQLLQATGKPNVSEAVESIKAGHGAVGQVAKLSAMLSELEARVRGQDVEALITKGKADNKITPALEKFCRDLGKQDVAMLTAYLSAAAAALPSGTRTEPRGEGTPAGDEELHAEFDRISAGDAKKAERLKKLAQEKGRVKR